ncbi:HTH_Tnp_Tc3_2 domain-containing protein [Trichonephila clavipes]|nr:HTH_Tnp_Tc3_2 domain-containing protein [Trichonephila clavipes]
MNKRECFISFSPNKRWGAAKIIYRRQRSLTLGQMTRGRSSSICGRVALQPDIPDGRKKNPIASILVFEPNDVWYSGHEKVPTRKTGSVATRKTTRREDRRIVGQELVDLTVTRSTIRADVGVAIVPQTISRHLAEANLKSNCPFLALPLTPEHRQLRLQWCQARSMWNVTDWQKVVFSDEYRFVLGTDDNRVRVMRQPGERYNSPHTVLRHTARTARVMVWGHSL